MLLCKREMRPLSSGFKNAPRVRTHIYVTCLRCSGVQTLTGHHHSSCSGDVRQILRRLLVCWRTRGCNHDMTVWCVLVFKNQSSSIIFATIKKIIYGNTCEYSWGEQKHIFWRRGGENGHTVGARLQPCATLSRQTGILAVIKNWINGWILSKPFSGVKPFSGGFV